MKKILFLSALALGLMTSCSEDEYIPSSSLDANSIAFSTQSGVSTRSGSTATSLEKFTVDAVTNDGTQYFAGTEFAFNSNMGVFQSNTPYYWPLTNSLSFYAINTPGTVSYNEQNVPEYSYQNWGGETDLVAATVLSGEKKIPYPLKFQHVLSQVYISAEAENKTEELTYQLVSVDMKAACNGTYKFADATNGVGTWEIDGNVGKGYSFNDALPISFAQDGKAYPNTTYWNILPVTDNQIVFRVCYKVFKNGQLIADFTGENGKNCIIEHPSLLSGKKYIYNFLLTRGTDDAITFTTSMQNWTDGGTTNHTPVKLVTSLSVAPKDHWMTIGDTKQIIVDSFAPADAVPTVSWSSSNTNVATVDAETGLVTAVGPGVAVITAKTPNNVGATCNVRVQNVDGTDGNYGYVDLGFPNGLLWATQNVGATKMEDDGLFFQWGSTTGYTSPSRFTFTRSSYTCPNQITPETDAVTANMGGSWRMPDNGEFGNLKIYTNYYYTKIGKRTGWIFESKKDPSKFIFLPHSGAITGNNQVNENMQGLYYSSAWSGATYYLALLPQSVAVQSTTSQWMGLPMRGVCQK